MRKKEQLMTRTVVVWLGALLCCALWGSAFPCIKIGYQLFEIPSGATATQILFAGCRFTLAGILAIIIGSVLNHRILVPKKTSWGKIAKLCMLQTVAQYLFFYIGLANTSGVKASIIRRCQCIYLDSGGKSHLSSGETDNKKDGRLSDWFCRSCAGQYNGWN